MFLKLFCVLKYVFKKYMGELCFLREYNPDFALGISEKSGYSSQKFTLLQKLGSSKFSGKFH